MSRQLDLDEIKSLLCEPGQLETLAESLFGPPNKDTLRRSEWRWGRQGSLALVVRTGGGKRRGSFFSHESSSGGSVLDMIMFGRGCGFREAVDHACSSLGYDKAAHVPSAASDAVLQERARKRAEQEREAEREAAQKAYYAARLHAAAEPVAGTIAERYLIETRGIPMPESGWPAAVLFHPGSRSLLLSGTTDAGELRSVQRVFLTPTATKIGPEELEARNLRAVKQTNGSGDGVAVRLPGDSAEPLLFAEGPETGLSAWVATGYETWIALGGLRKLEPVAGRKIVICRDDDKRFAPADKSLTKLLADWKRDGVDVVVATPWATRRFDKSDMNDVIQASGVSAVRERIERAINPLAAPVRRQPITEVRQELDSGVAGFFRIAAAYQPDDDGEAAAPPPVHAIRVDVGSGKSRAAFRSAARQLIEMRARGDKRAIAVAVPTHKLGDELAQTFASIALEMGGRLAAHVWRGMEALDPDHSDASNDRVVPALKTKMCRNLDAVKAAREAGMPVLQAACRMKRPGEEPILCPFFETCGYQKQRQVAADLWIVPHELMFTSKPAALGTLALLIVDEASWSDGLEGVHGRPMGLPIEELKKPDVIRNGEESLVDRIATDRLHYLRNRLIDGLQRMTDGPVIREALLGELDQSNAGEAYALEWRRIVDPDLHPGLTPEERKERVRSAAGNSRTMRLAKVWKGVKALLQDAGPLASGWLSVATEPDDENGGMVRVLHLKGRKDVRKGWQVPTLLLDATMNIELVRPYWPQVEMTAELLATAPHQHIRQVVDRAFSKSMLDPLDDVEAERDPVLARRRRRNLRDVHAALMREARHYAPERVLIVCQKAVKEALAGFGPLPPNVELAHHNAVAGRDEWGPQPERRGVRALIVVGRTMPTLGSVHRLAEALTGSAIERLEGGWYGRGDAVRERLDGQVDAIESDRHPDPIAEGIRWQICEGELVQIIGRGRGVNRTAENPLDVLVLTDAPVPMPIAETLAFSDLEPTPDDLMIAAAGIVLRNARHAASLFPQLWPSHKAAEHAFTRNRGVPHTCKDNLFIYGNGGLLDRKPGFCRMARYQVAGPGQKPADAVFDPSVCVDPEAFLTAKLGPLAWCQIEPAASDPVISPTAAEAAHPAPEPPPAQEPPMAAANDEHPPIANAERLAPEQVYPPMKPATPIMPIAGLWRVPNRAGPQSVVIERADGAPIELVAITPFPPFCRGHYASPPLRQGAAR